MVRIVSIELIIVVTGAVLICCQTQDRKTLGKLNLHEKLIIASKYIL